MYVLDYLIYHLRPYGIVNTPDVLPNKLALGELMPAPKEPQEPKESSTTLAKKESQ